MHTPLYKMLLLLLVSRIGLTPALAQTPTDGFVDTQFKDYQQWLQSTRLDSCIKADTAGIDQDSVVLYLETKGLKNWNKLRFYADSAFGVDLAGVLYHRWSFQLDHSPCLIRVEAGDALITIRSDRRQVNMEIRRTLGPVSGFPDDAVSTLVKLNDTKTFSTRKAMNVVRDRIKSDLKAYFEPYKGLFVSYAFEDLSQDDSTMELAVSNIKKAVLQEGYFEHLAFHFALRSRDGGTVLTFQMEGKYGSGIIWAPLESRYHPMTPQYQGEFDHFQSVLGNRIHTIIN
jgi:hypothetical protein